MTSSVTILAATLVLFRARAPDESECPTPEVLMIERGGGMSFAAGAMVFPGGRVDPGDYALAARIAPEIDADAMAARIAAIRETIEEAGVAAGLVPTPDIAAVTRLRAGLGDGVDFATLLTGEGLRIDPAALTPFARWRPNMNHTRNFDTFFFIAEAPADVAATPDGGESVRAVWATAHALLDGAAAGHHNLIFPTRRNLERLAKLASFEEACRHAADLPFLTITPWIEERDGESWVCIPEGGGYPVTAERLSTASRG